MKALTSVRIYYRKKSTVNGTVISDKVTNWDVCHNHYGKAKCDVFIVAFLLSNNDIC